MSTFQSIHEYRRSGRKARRLYCIRDQRGYDYWTDDVVYTTLKEAKKGLIEARRHAAQLSYDESSYAAAHLEIFLKDSDGNDERFL